MIHFGWNASPKVPSKWVIRIALTQLIFWILMTLSDELIVANVGSFDWGQKDQKVFLNWSDATLGILSACSLLLVSSMAAWVVRFSREG